MMTEPKVEIVTSSMQTKHIRIMEPTGITHYSPPLPAFERVKLTDPATGRWVDRLGVYVGAI